MNSVRNYVTISLSPSRDLGCKAKDSGRGVADQGHGALGHPLAKRRRALHQTLRWLVEEIFHSRAQLSKKQSEKKQDVG